jgi:DNA-binding MarR family transcriptional regulator/GNAT superfamily N-acetyltransferase
LFDKGKYSPEDRPMHVDAVRRFNRFYTRRVGALRPGLLGSPYPLPQARVLYELGHRGRCTATELVRELDLDAGYLSRLLQPLRRAGLVRAKRSARDARASMLSLTAKGTRAFRALDARSRTEVSTMLGALADPERSRLVGAMQTVERLLQGQAAEPVLRAHRPGDMGWVVQAHGELYAREYGWDERFEALVARIAADFIDRFDAQRSRCFIAEVDGERVGSAFVVPRSRSVAKLRLLIVEPRARGRGLGRRLVEACIAFAREKRYRRLVLWTQSNLAAARAIYASCGFKLKRRERHATFGVKLTGEYWELAL